MPANQGCLIVSTHSRLKAAGSINRHQIRYCQRFNTQPPKGGWQAEWEKQVREAVSTHSRLKAAGTAQSELFADMEVSTHSRLKAAGFTRCETEVVVNVSTHSRLKAAGIYNACKIKQGKVFQHTAA